MALRRFDLEAGGDSFAFGIDRFELRLFCPEWNEAPFGIDDLIVRIIANNRAKGLARANVKPRRIIASLGCRWDQIEGVIVFSPSILDGEASAHGAKLAGIWLQAQTRLMLHRPSLLP